MKDGTEVKVVSCHTGHEFRIGEIVTRQSSEYDYEFKDSLGFVGSEGEVWYMCPGEYDIIDSESRLSRVAQLEDMLSRLVKENDLAMPNENYQWMYSPMRAECLKVLENKQ